MSRTLKISLPLSASWGMVMIEAKRPGSARGLQRKISKQALEDESITGPYAGVVVVNADLHNPNVLIPLKAEHSVTRSISIRDNKHLFISFINNWGSTIGSDLKSYG